MTTLISSLFSSTPYLISFILFLILLEQISYLIKKRSIPGPTLVFPFLGNAIPLVTNPTKFWNLQSTLAKSTNLGISANYIIGKFIVFIRDTELSHKVFSNGAIVFPSVLESSFQGFTEPDRFDPDRFSEERKEDQIFKRNFLAFGAGAHQCVGQRYALNHLVLFIAMFVSLIDFKRDVTDGCDEITYVPTICPKDDCRVFLSRRSARYPSFPALEQIVK
ncbi:putative cytochrome P450 [Lupinus albus]|uniref:C-22 sterol desaturase n=1 Tax=Lupinus albus TaxID=3870 RepID=A0A6A4NZL7_LUPAL|nr:putative cytochrome P450 [Lupinus albus]